MSSAPRAASPGRRGGGRSAARRPDSIISLSEDDLKGFAGSGSLPVNEEELNAAFDFFDVEGRGRLTANDLRVRLSAFYKNLPQKEFKTLISEPNFTKETLRNLLANNELGQFDPVKEAFKVYDPHGTGYVDNATLRSIFENLGYGEITDDDLDVLVQTADGDKDGRISLEDFRGMLANGKQ